MEEHLSFKQLLAIICAGLFSFCGVLIETATNITFPTLMKEFHISTSLVQWMTSGNLLMMGILIPISPYLKKKFKTKKLFLIAGILFASGLMIDIFAGDFTILLIGRLIQGAGVGIALPMMYNIILQESPQRMLGTLMGVGAFITAAAPAVGPVFGGMMTQYFTWRYIFIFVLPFIILSCIVGYWCITNTEINQNERLDFIGYVYIALAFVCIVMASSLLDQILKATFKVLVLFLIGVTCLILFYKRQKQTEHPLIQIRILQNKSFVFHTLAIMFLQMTTLALGLLLPSFVQIVLHDSASQAGIVLLPGAIIGAIMSPVGGILLDKFGPKKPIGGGVACCFVSIVLYICLFKYLNFTLCLAIYFVYSLGIGLIVGNTMTCALGNLDEDVQPDGNATLQTLMQLSGGIGTSICATILSFLQSGVAIDVGTQRGALFVFVYLLLNIIIVLISQMIAFKGGK